MILGIDPGKTGALAIYDDVLDLLVEVIDMPVIAAGTGGKMIVDEDALARWVAERADRLHHAILEQVGARPGESPVASFSFGTTYGLLRGLLACHQLPRTFVTPQKWKKALGVPAVKDAARARASQLMPRQSHLWTRKKDDGRAEAAMIAYWGARHAS